MLVVGGMIGVGKTTLASIIAADLNIDLYTENVEGNDILPLFYTASEEEQNRKRYPFLLQLEFLTSRYRDIKHALFAGPSIMDRSIYEDWYFAKVNTDLGRISPEEFKLYAKILDEMMKEISQFPKKAPDLMIYLHASFETILERIGSRGRDFEQDDKLVSYYRSLWEGYDDWVHNHYAASPVLLVDADQFDFYRAEDRKHLVDSVKNLQHNPTGQYMTLNRP
ncbi:deoxynucleoside kinase [Arcanobacterium pinnipediorum]|uniref:Deoxynucleoside kinase n=1 Tax=Arcanobacterium pinnipediorum TaxID=1503041 RepID=A0ABY5AIL9_9ACTO|nr:deoxynucleoside kinase [Arcanobacterium pinnipediorum]USR79836.1 deoxynucleoside kinase [Arcanobacterium pinnipediorum]